MGNDDEKFSRLGSNRGNRHKRLYKKALARSRVRDYSLVGLIGIGTVIWSGTEKAYSILHTRIASDPTVIELQHRLQDHELQAQRYIEAVHDHEIRIRELEHK